MRVTEPTVLLSPVAETADGLLARNFFTESTGFGAVTELHERDKRLGNVAVSFGDLEDGLDYVTFAHDVQRIKDVKDVTDLIAFSTAICCSKTSEASKPGM